MTPNALQIEDSLPRPRFYSEAGRLQSLLAQLTTLFHLFPQPVRLAANRPLERLKIRERLPGVRVQYPGAFAFPIPAGDPMYTRIFTEGAWEPKETSAIRRLLRPGDFALDVGGNYGWFSLAMASSVGPDGLVWAFEPVRTFASQLRSNIELNELDNVQVFDLAIGASHGEVGINVFEGLPHGHASAATLGRSDFVTSQVPLRTLDELVDLHPDRAPALIKVDVEGFELQVLEGSQALLKGSDPPIWVLEVNEETSAALGYQPSRLISVLTSHASYKIYTLNRHRLKRMYSLVPVTDFDQPRHGDTWICIPDSKRNRLVSSMTHSVPIPSP